MHSMNSQSYRSVAEAQHIGLFRNQIPAAEYNRINPLEYRIGLLKLPAK